MKVFLLMMACCVAMPAFAEQTAKEKAAAAANDVKRPVKKGVNRVKEAVCAKGDLECAAEKAKHRVEEGADTVGDKAQEQKDKMD